jgi:hypothetical protein
MTKDDQINFIREKCIEANRDIVELKVGCEVDRGADIEKIKEYVVGYFGTTIALVRDHKALGTFLPFEVSKDLASSWTILGRPIRLADVLLAFCEIDKESDYIEIVRTWNLRADDLREQSEEKIKFLYNLLQ